MIQNRFIMRLVVACLMMFFVSCSSLKYNATDAEIANLKDIVKSKKIALSFDWAQPIGLNMGVTGLQSLMPPGSTTNNINLIGNPNFLNINKDSIHMDLPYYGQQQLGRGYNTNDTGVSFKGTPYKTETEFKENKYILKYWLDSKYDDYRIIITLFANKKSVLRVNSSHRTTINYDGTWKPLTEEKNKETKNSK